MDKKVKNAQLCGLHSIIKKNAYSQALFMWVDSAIENNPTLTPRAAIMRFSRRFELDALDVNSAVTQYNRLRNDFIRNNKLFES